MRLIDADMVKQYILTEGFYCDTKADKEDTAEEIDKLFPTVDAIPVEWIIKYLQEYYDEHAMRNWCAEEIPEEYWFIKSMLKDWSKENATV